LGISDFLGAFDPFILLHDLFSYKYKDMLEKEILPRKSREDYLNEIEFWMGDLYEKIDDNIPKMKKSLSSLIDKFFMNPDLETVIHNKDPYHNRQIALINPANITIGSRVIDLGSYLEWPSIRKNIKESPFIKQSSLINEYLVKRDKLYKQERIRYGNPSFELLNEGTYFGGFYSILKETSKYNIDKKDIHNTIIDVLGELSNNNSDAKALWEIFSGFKTKVEQHAKNEGKIKNDKKQH